MHKLVVLFVVGDQSNNINVCFVTTQRDCGRLVSLILRRRGRLLFRPKKTRIAAVEKAVRSFV